MQKNIKEVIEEYADMVYRIAITRCKNVENAEDIFQEVFIKYNRKSPNFQTKEHEKAWLIRVTINLTKNLNKSAWNRKVEALDENISFETENQSEVFEAVCKLPQDYRTVIYLFYYEGYKVNEIASLINKKEGTIKTWLFRAREALKKELKGGFENE